MIRPFRSRPLRNSRALRFGLVAVLGLAGLVAGAGQAWACGGFACVGGAIGRSAHDTGAPIEKGVHATGRATGQVAEGTARVATGHP